MGGGGLLQFIFLGSQCTVNIVIEANNYFALIIVTPKLVHCKSAQPNTFSKFVMDIDSIVILYETRHMLNSNTRWYFFPLSSWINLILLRILFKSFVICTLVLSKADDKFVNGSVSFYVFLVGADLSRFAFPFHFCER